MTPPTDTAADTYVDPRIPASLQQPPPAQAPSAVVDCTGLFCPIPIVRGAAALKQCTDGGIVEVISTDPGFVPDIQRWAKHRTDRLLCLRQTAPRQWRAWLQRAAHGVLRTA